jgi:hypothetical protein
LFTAAQKEKPLIALTVTKNDALFINLIKMATK